MKNINKSVLVIFGVILSVGLMVFLAANIIPRALVTMSKASAPGILSVEDSYVLGERILANSDGVDKCKVNVFLIDKGGKGIPGKQVSLKGMTNIIPAVATTDAMGKASFEMTSTTDGQFVLTANSGGTAISKKVTVTFRKY